MEKISLIAWRRRERKFPETEAQRRARARERDHGDVPLAYDPCRLEGLSTTSVFDLPDLDEALCMHTADPSDFLALAPSDHDRAQAPEPLAATCVDIELTAEQSQVLYSLPLLSDATGRGTPPPLFELSQAPTQGRITLQFSLHPKTVPEMISVKELCHQLKVGRRAVMRLVRRGELRCYRIANRYRFAVSDVNHYLDRIAQR